MHPPFVSQLIGLTISEVDVGELPELVVLDIAGASHTDVILFIHPDSRYVRVVWLYVLEIPVQAENLKSKINIVV